MARRWRVVAGAVLGFLVLTPLQAAIACDWDVVTQYLVSAQNIHSRTAIFRTSAETSVQSVIRAASLLLSRAAPHLDHEHVRRWLTVFGLGLCDSGVRHTRDKTRMDPDSEDSKSEHGARRRASACTRHGRSASGDPGIAGSMAASLRHPHPACGVSFGYVPAVVAGGRVRRSRVHLHFPDGELVVSPSCRTSPRSACRTSAAEGTARTDGLFADSQALLRRSAAEPVSPSGAMSDWATPRENSRRPVVRLPRLHERHSLVLSTQPEQKPVIPVTGTGRRAEGEIP